jgi:MOSC domain-containing protein YiiM
MDASTPTVLTIQVGMPQTMEDPSQIGRRATTWVSGIYKDTIAGPVWLGFDGLEGDGQADLEAHGGPDKAALLYAAGHYPEWRATLDKPNLAYGGFGENLTVTHQTEETVCIGDMYTLGDARIQISQPRFPCWKLSRRQGVRDLAEQVQDNGRSGWYVRVIQEGLIEAGQPLLLIDRPYPDLSVACTSAVRYRRNTDPATRAALAACPALAPDLRGIFARPLDRAAD